MEKHEQSATPRSGRDLLMGIPWLARAIDKGRMALDNRLGEYVFPCPMDEEILTLLGLTTVEFLTILKNTVGDGEVLKALSLNISSLGPGEWMRLDVFPVRHSRLLADQDREEGRYNDLRDPLSMTNPEM